MSVLYPELTTIRVTFRYVVMEGYFYFWNATKDIDKEFDIPYQWNIYMIEKEIRKAFFPDINEDDIIVIKTPQGRIIERRDQLEDCKLYVVSIPQKS